MRPRRTASALALTLISAFAVTACAASAPSAPHAASGATRPRAPGGGADQDAALSPQTAGPAQVAHAPGTKTTSASAHASHTSSSQALPRYGTGIASVPAAGQPVSTAHPDHVIGTGTPASCTSAAVVAAVAQGGVITFSCGPQPVTITMQATAKVRNTSTEVVLDGQGRVTLSGDGARRILYQDTCDPAETWSTSHCQDQATPHLIVQNLTLANGNSTGQTYDGGGGGAIFDRGGQLTVINDKFTGNRCDSTGPDLGGAAIRALSQDQNQPVYVVGSTFTGGVCSNGGALSSIGVSWMVLNDIMTGNQAVGDGANPAQAGTPGGGSGGAIYNDGDSYTTTIDGSVISGNSAREGGGAVFYVSNDRTGTLQIENSRLTGNPNAGFSTAGFPGIFFLGRGQPAVTASTDS
ncbi:MAG: hypothetical protein JO016_01260 [Actinobacteria bacterium]|nr:hypothetical protein [Actinomycetota bacterium]